jgi:hypothetical protein
MKLCARSAQKHRPAFTHHFIEARRTCMAKCKSALNAPRKYTTRQTAPANKETIELQSRFEHECNSLHGIIATVDSIGTKKLRMGLQRDLNCSIAPYRKMPEEVRSGTVRLARRSKGQTIGYVLHMCRKVQERKARTKLSIPSSGRNDPEDSEHSC